MTNEEVLNKIHELNFAMFQEMERVCKKYDIEYFFACGALLGAVRHKGFIPWDNDIDIWITRENFAKLYEHRDELHPDFKLVMPESTGKNRYLDTVPRLNYKYMYIKMDEDACRYYNNHNNRMDLDMFFIDKTYNDWRGKLQRLEMIFIYGLMNAYRHKSVNEGYSSALKAAGAVLNIVGKCIPLATLRKWSTRVATRYNNRADADYYFASNDGAAWKNIVPKHVYEKVVRLPFESTDAPVPVGYDEVLKIWFGDYMKLPPEDKRIPHWGHTLIEPSKFVFEEPPAFKD